MLKDLRARAYKVRRADLAWTSIIQTLGGELSLDPLARDVADETFELRSRAPLYKAEEPFEEFDAALAFLLMTAENARRKIKAEAKATGRNFAGTLSRSPATAEYFREIAKALTLLFKEDETC